MKPHYLTVKDDSVHYAVCEAILTAEPYIAIAFAAIGIQGVITAAKDGQHSEYTRHFSDPTDPRPAQALDLRTREMDPAKVEPFAMRILGFLNKFVTCDGRWTIVMHVGVSQHLHLEWNPDGTPPNVVDYKPGQDFYRSAT